MKKTKVILAAGILSVASVLGACTAKNEESGQGTSGSIAYKIVTNGKETDNVIEIGKEINITKGDVVSRINDYTIAAYMNYLIDGKITIQLFPPSEEEIKEKAIEYELNYDDLTKEEKTELIYDAAYSKAVKSLYEPKEDELKEIFDTYYKDSENSYEEVVEELKVTAAHINGNPLLEKKIAEYKEENKITFDDKDLEEIYNLYNN